MVRSLLLLITIVPLQGSTASRRWKCQFLRADGSRSPPEVLLTESHDIRLLSDCITTCLTAFDGITRYLPIPGDTWLQAWLYHTMCDCIRLCLMYTFESPPPSRGESKYHSVVILPFHLSSSPLLIWEGVGTNAGEDMATCASFSCSPSATCLLLH